CWILDISPLSGQSYVQCFTVAALSLSPSRVHVHNMQVCYICIHVPCWGAAPINLNAYLNSSFTNI
uniref:Uncharacterized protein n=1 Tax=Macaca fascicularis TaxID=9541 RepID=A0A7N9CHR5_MACFA